MRIALMIVPALLAAATAAQCQPAKSETRLPAPPQLRIGQIVLASADDQASAPQVTQPAPAKRRIVRVTTCRCGDPQAASETRED